MAQLCSATSQLIIPVSVFKPPLRPRQKKRKKKRASWRLKTLTSSLEMKYYKIQKRATCSPQVGDLNLGHRFLPPGTTPGVATASSAPLGLSGGKAHGRHCPADLRGPKGPFSIKSSFHTNRAYFIRFGPGLKCLAPKVDPHTFVFYQGGILWYLKGIPCTPSFWATYTFKACLLGRSESHPRP